MSELKERIFCDIDEVFPRGYCGPLPSHEARPYYLKSEADEVIAHHKYKRCLDKVRWCKDKMDTIKNGYMVSGIMTTCPPKCNPKFSFYKKWHKRWLELAEKFKEAK